jgi:hypothetical protein
VAKPAHTRLTFEGHVGPSSSAVTERWSFSLHAVDDAAIVGATEVTLNALANSAAVAYDANIQPNMPNNCHFTRCKVASIGADGLYRTRADGSYIAGEWEGTSTGGQAASSMPLQVALCVSLVTPRSGPTGKGRFFLPWPAVSLDAGDRKIPTAQLQPIVDDCAAFLGALNDLAGINVAVVSSKGYSSDVTALRIGRVPDTLRSRREDVAEGYITQAVPQ